MTDKKPTDKHSDKPVPNPYEAQEVDPIHIKERGVFSSILLVFWYMFLVFAGLAILGLVALFVVCIV